ncbi:preprotein translocase subunit SecY [Proteinivorax hydrogeniformans]|uniref:Protein translocase subunit SecY n=1 Tax=Proteinivorax hydrogeniformans TaxID=1826727 RepID=A0AAU8HU49_9FIRM
MKFLETLRNAWKVKDIRTKILFTLAMLLVFRLGTFVPVPGVDAGQIPGILGGGEEGVDGLIGLFDTLGGGAFANFSIFAMGIMPYINASIIMQLLTVVVPTFERWSKEGEEGKKKLQQAIRYATVIIGSVQSIGLSFAFRNAISGYWDFTAFERFTSITLIVLSLTAGTAFLMWLGEQITEKGIGNGISLIIFAGIVSQLPVTVTQYYQLLAAGTVSIFAVALLLLVAVMVVAGVVYIQEGERRIPVQYAKRVVGRKMYGGQATHIPLKVNQAGVIPVIFATSILMFPSAIGQFTDNAVVSAIAGFFEIGSISGQILQVVLIVFFAYFYTAITVNPEDLADNMKKNGGFIPGIRPGRPTAGHIQTILSRITLVGAIFLALIVMLPFILGGLVDGINIGIGGTSLLIVVGVALETMKQIESQMLMRHYKGFMS